MRRALIALSAGLMMVVGLAVANAAEENAKTYQGELIDMHCFAKSGAKGADHAECGQKCASGGMPVGVLTSGDKAYTLLANPKPLAQYMAKTIRVTGEVNPKTMTLQPDKIEVQENGNWKEVPMEEEHS